MSEEAAATPTRAPAKKRAPAKTSKEESEPIEPVEAVAAGDAQSAPEPGDFAGFIPVEVVDVIVRLPNPNPVLVLRTVDPPQRSLEIPIGAAEGISIANALHDVSTPKPLTHELFADTLTALDASVAVGRITAVEGGSFYGEIVVSGGNSGQQTIRCRPSDAVAMALRQRPPAPIVASSAVLETAGIEDDTSR